MQIIADIDSLIAWRNNQNGTIGYVATMGALHQGHLSLMRDSKKNNDKTIVSIFVNPAQFGANEDFDKYPRAKDKDIELCRIAGVDVVFTPEVCHIYPIKDEVNIIPPIKMANVFEGAFRPGHFNGVLLVIAKFFNLIRPTNAYFGKKDAQQLLIIRRMVRDLFFNINIVGCDIVRDSNNLALSSRNVYLDSASYNLALRIPKALEIVSHCVLSNKLESSVLEKAALDVLGDLEVDYCKIVDFNLNPIEKVKNGESLLIIAVRVGGVRLLDNCWF
ncbi:pantoate--beta-alanine ligase [Helicobacter sp. 16-1353]|uniref:pantoate--beta-alanine ligase n=1 Tax=Helicobacter sp. 16-1353 TaxID=2004996 RepID=UPI000DCE117E|nr:pantoate--beta-alanine ligase [Helicobacter sp. 16-1353]RAX54895.1 pantoate--beta-alanine ligase [Helicobacter sp. 16-1353]